MNTQIIAIANQKGGVGKTTTCANLGIGLAQAGKKVLLIDGDPQGSLTISLGHPQPDKLSFTLSDAMGRILMDEPMRPGEGILHHPEGVDLMPADIQLSGMEVSLVNAMSRETILRQYLDTLKGQYSHTCHVGGSHPDGDHDGQGMGRHGPELPAQPAGAGLPGVFDYRLRGDLRRAGAEHRHRGRRYSSKVSSANAILAFYPENTRVQTTGQ